MMYMHVFVRTANKAKINFPKIFLFYCIKISLVFCMTANPVAVFFAFNIIVVIFAFTFPTAKLIFVFVCVWRNSLKFLAAIRTLYHDACIVVIFFTCQRFHVFVVAFSATKVPAWITTPQRRFIHPKMLSTSLADSFDFHF